MSLTDQKPKFQYQEGETVLCYHGPLLYEAKVFFLLIIIFWLLK